MGSIENHPASVPAIRQGAPAFEMYYSANIAVRRLDMRHLTTALRFTYCSGFNNTVSDCNFRDCGLAIDAYYTMGYSGAIGSCNVSSLLQTNGLSWSTTSGVTSICDDHKGLPLQGTPITLGSASSGAVDYGGDVDFFKLTLGSSQTVQFWTTGNTDTYGYLLDSALSVLAYDTSGGITWPNFSLGRTLAAGTYYVCVRGGSSGTTGAYVLNAQTNAPPTISSLSPVTILKDSGTPLLGFTVGDTETQPNALLVTATSDNPTLVPNSMISLGGGYNNRTVYVQATNGATGVANITLTVSDGTLIASTVLAVTVQAKAATPVFSTSFDLHHSVAIVSATSSTPGAIVRYTTDGSAPNAGSSSNPPVFGVATTVRARAFCTGFFDSDIANTTVSHSSSTVSFSPHLHNPIQYSLGPMALQLSAQAGETIVYWAGSGGSPFSCSSGSTVNIDGIDSGSGTVQAFAYGPTTLRGSTSYSGEFVFRLPPPTSSVTANGYSQSTLTLANAVAGVVVRYTTNGAIPTAGSAQYLGPMTFSQPTKVYASAFKPGYVPSGHVSAWVSRLPEPRIATSAGTLSGSLVVNNAIDVWILPNFGFTNAYAEEPSATGWTHATRTNDAPNSSFPGSFVGVPGALNASSQIVDLSYGRTLSMAAWIRGVSGAGIYYAGLINLDAAGNQITHEDIEDTSIGGLTWMTSSLAPGATSVNLADTTVFVPVYPDWWNNLFVPITNYSRTAPVGQGNQPALLQSFYRQLTMDANTGQHVTNVNAGSQTVSWGVPYAGPFLPIGTPVSRRRFGGTYQYALAANALATTNWYRQTSTFSDLRSGTESGRLMAVISYSGGTNEMTGLELWEGTQSDRPRLHYTTNGNAAVYTAGTAASGPVRLTLDGNPSITVSVGQRGTYYLDSPVVQRTFIFQVATPSLTFVATNASQVLVSATCATSGSTLRYTLDGSDPVDTSPVFANPLLCGLESTVKVRGFKSNYTASVVAGRLGIPTLASFGGIYTNDLNLTVTTPPPSGAQVQWLRPEANLLDTSTWNLGSPVNAPGFIINGAASENAIEMGTGPYGTQEKLWVAYNDAASDADGGWYTTAVAVDRTQTYRFSVWLYKTGGTHGLSYLGAGWNGVSSLTGSSAESVQPYPYFWFGALPLDRWHLVVGYVHPAGHTGTTYYGRVYDDTGAVIATGVDFKWLTNTTTAIHRSYLYYCTNTSVRQYFANPRLERVSSVSATPYVALATPSNSPVAIALSGNVGNLIEARSYSPWSNILSSPIRSETYRFQVATPSLTFVATNASQVLVSATCGTSGSTLRYTLDGSDPMDTSPIITSPLPCGFSSTVKVRGFKSNYIASVVAGRLGVPTLSASGGIYTNDLNLTVTTAPPTGAQVQWLRREVNLLDTSTWNLGSPVNAPGFIINGAASENAIEMGTGPYGTQEKLWVAYNDAASDADGGWYTTAVAVDRTQTYRFSVWLYKTGGTHGLSYLGAGWNGVSALTGSSAESVQPYPYFWFGALPLDRWHLIVGYVHPAGHTGTTYYGRVYDDSGAVIATGVDFKWLTNTTTAIHRSYLYYCTNTSVRQYFANPRLERVSSPNTTAYVGLASPSASPVTMALSGNVSNVVEARSYSPWSNILSSPIRSETYRFQVAAPSVAVDGAFQLTATTATTGGPPAIRYTLNGADPGPTSTLYPGPIRAPAGTSKWRAFRANYLDSAVTTYLVTDTDSDGLPDLWETQHLGSPNFGPNDDPEEDGVTNAAEYNAGTNPATPGLRIRIVPPRTILP